MKVEGISIGPSDALTPVESVSAVVGCGLEGDRHFRADGHKRAGAAMTLIEAEVLEDVGLTGAQSRRQVVVRGVRLNDLVGRRFRVGEVECYGTRLCEPCAHLEGLTKPGAMRALAHTGVRADILTDGEIAVGDAVYATDSGVSSSIEESTTSAAASASSSGG